MEDRRRLATANSVADPASATGSAESQAAISFDFHDYPSRLPDAL